MELINIILREQYIKVVSHFLSNALFIESSKSENDEMICNIIIEK